MTRCLQDGLLKYWLSQAKFADANIEARLDKEPFDMEESMAKKSSKPKTYAATSPLAPPGSKPNGVDMPKLLPNSVKLKGTKTK